MLEASRSGEGQVVDAAMVDGVASMMTMFFGLLAGGMWKDERQSNLLDGGAPFFKSYETKDGRYIVVAALEQRFYRALLEALEIRDIDPEDQYSTEKWSEHEAIFEKTFRTKSRDEWTSILEHTDACFAPVLSLTEAPQHPHNIARGTFVTVDDVLQPGPAPRFSRTESEIQNPPNEPGDVDRHLLADWGLSETEIDRYLNINGR
jgi:alpha-methylacyl-CoA racemase